MQSRADECAQEKITNRLDNESRKQKRFRVGDYRNFVMARNILEIVKEDYYKELENDLKEHYKNDKRVNDVFINNAGTIMIDCRN